MGICRFGTISESISYIQSSIWQHLPAALHKLDTVILIYKNYRNLQEFTRIPYKFKIWESVESVAPQNHYPIVWVRSGNIWALYYTKWILLTQFTGITRIYRNIQEFRLYASYDNGLSLEINIYMLYINFESHQIA